MENFQLLWDCIKSGQVSHYQIEQHLKDKEFKNWLIKNNLIQQ